MSKTCPTVSRRVAIAVSPLVPRTKVLATSRCLLGYVVYPAKPMRGTTPHAKARTVIMCSAVNVHSPKSRRVGSSLGLFARDVFREDPGHTTFFMYILRCMVETRVEA